MISATTKQGSNWQALAIDQSAKVPHLPNRDEPLEVIQLRGLLLDMRDILTSRTPSQWLKSTDELFTKLLGRAVADDPTLHPKLAHFITTEIPALHEILLRTKVETTESLISRQRVIDQVISFIEKVSEHFLQRMNYSPQLNPVSLVTYKMMAELSDGKLKVVENPTGEGRLLRVTLGKGEEHRHYIPIPGSEQVALKGGPPRAILKMIAGAPIRSVKREFPPNDIDAVVKAGNDSAVEEALRLGAEREGIEGVESLLAEGILADRDITLNSCILTSEGLRFTQAAYDDAQRGLAVPLHSDRGMFGRNYFRCPDGVILVQPRCLFRLIKFVAEEKAESFQVYQRNSQIDLGVYILTLARKFAPKDNAHLLFSRTYELLEQVGQVRSNEKNLFDVMTRVHKEHPYFDFESPKMDRFGVAKWLASKLDRFVVRAFRQLENVTRAFDLVPEDGDDLLVTVKLSGEDRPMSPGTHENTMELFIRESKERTNRWREENPNARF